MQRVLHLMGAAAEFRPPPLFFAPELRNSGKIQGRSRATYMNVQFSGSSAEAWQQPVGELTETSRFRLEYIPPPAELAHHITIFYHFICDERDIRDIQPATIGHLMLMPHGVGAVHFRNGRSDPSHEVNVLTPVSVAAPFTVNGPFHAIGAVLTPLGWAELTGLDAAEYGNRFCLAGDLLPDGINEEGARLCAAYRAGALGGPECAMALGQWIAAHLTPIADGHRRLIGLAAQWLGGDDLNPDLAALYAASPYSQRQTQRLVERYFGHTPTALKRKYRALRAAAAMAQPELSDAEEAAIGEAFYDQPHMIREIRLFAGRTPARLSDEPDSYLTEMLDLRNMREIASPAKR